ncbi:Uncharacterized protein LI90_575 [Carbonactinospora thermoautotrophica]|uniref:Uncharacterized protein n=1 Tax=Carbonactinospora thermoautotrophica TaxID=1469144 RepID=A0A132MMI7_9ACTN|nr:Uncharacterized protein LI90_575 [Carbonactinospora thermoautotrophica]
MEPESDRPHVGNGTRPGGLPGWEPPGEQLDGEIVEAARG